MLGPTPRKVRVAGLRTLSGLGILSVACALVLTSACASSETRASPTPDPGTLSADTLPADSPAGRVSAHESPPDEADRSSAGVLRVEVRQEPNTARVGSELVLHLDLTNQTLHEIGAVLVQLGGDWAGYAIQELRPNGSLHTDQDGVYFLSSLRIPPGETRVLDIVTIPQHTGDLALTFSVREVTADTAPASPD